MALHVYNLLSQRLERFEPLEPGVVKLYVCGPTVYDKAHIGHALSAMVFDVIRRYLEFRGYRVQHVMNFTDVDDKIINRANELGLEAMTLAQRYIDAWLEHVGDLNLLPAHHTPRASQVMPQIITMIEQLQAQEMAYTLAGDLFYDVDQFPEYGKLSRRPLAAARPGTRVAVDERKDEAADFALWKAAKANEPAWDSPWGPGRPGWHIECSAMILHYLGEQIDIHGGGNDLIFPHHENEIAQSEAYTGKVPFVRYWLHNGMLQWRGEKMSKSLGNLVTVEDFLAEHEADVLRLAILNGHYRKPLSYDHEVVAQAEQALKRLRGGLRPSPHSQASGAAADSLGRLTASSRDQFIAAMDDDFNTAAALGQLFTLIKALNTARDAGVGGEVFSQAQATLRELAGVLGLSLAGKQVEETADPFIEILVELRSELRQAKQWALADSIRDRLQQQGIVLEDGPEGTSWYRR
jgi:cysteinyl-tRNA synthetase